jgi:hypothetical protein
MNHLTLLFALARVVGWLIVPVYVVSMFIGFWLGHSAGLWNEENPVEHVALLVGFGGFAVVGSLLAVKRPTNLIGWIMVTISLIVGVFHTSDTYAAYVMVTRGQPDAFTVLGAWIQAWYWYLLLALALVYLPLLFPDGRLPSRRWLPVAIIPGIGTLSMVVLGALTETLHDSYAAGYTIENPIGIEGLDVEGLPVFGLLIALFGVGVIGAVASVVVRFRRSRGAEREQMKWFVCAVAPMLVIPIGDYLPGIIGSVAFAGVLIALPTAIGIAVLKYHLYDIDVIINRTLVYGSLTVMLALLYFGGVSAIQALFAALTGQEEQPQLAIVVSTLVIAALFNPLRRRIQSFIDRSFYRSKYDAAKTLEAFSARLRDETHLHTLSEDLMGVIKETMQPAHVSLWLHADPALKDKKKRAAIRESRHDEQ